MKFSILIESLILQNPLILESFGIDFDSLFTEIDGNLRLKPLKARRSMYGDFIFKMLKFTLIISGFRFVISEFLLNFVCLHNIRYTLTLYILSTFEKVLSLFGAILAKMTSFLIPDTFGSVIRLSCQNKYLATFSDFQFIRREKY